MSPTNIKTLFATIGDDEDFVFHCTGLIKLTKCFEAVWDIANSNQETY